MAKGEIDLLPKQDEAWTFIFDDPKVNEVGYGGAAGGGKTRLGWYVIIYLCERYYGVRFAVGRKELKNLRITTLVELFVIFQDLGYKKDRDYTFNAQDNILRFLSTGSEVILLDMAYSPQDPEYTRFGSLNLTAAWAEESNESPDKGIQILKTRVGRQNKLRVATEGIRPDECPVEDVKPVWLETFNPNKGRVHRDYYKPWKDGTMPAYRAFVRALPGDNFHLPPAYIENLKRADKTTRERLLYGNFDYDADPMKIMAYDAIMDLRTNVLPDLPLGVAAQRYLITDVARFGGDRIVIGEFEDYDLVGLTVNRFRGLDETEQDIRDQAAESRIPYANILTDDDGVGGSIPDHLKGTKGFNGGSRPRTIHDDFTGKDVAENYSNLRSQCYFRLSELVNTHLMAVRLRYFKTNIEGYTQEQALSELEEELDAIKRVSPTGGQNEKLAIVPKPEIKEVLGRSPDLADVLMMRMYYEIKPVPARRGSVQLSSNTGKRRTKTVINRGK